MQRNRGGAAQLRNALHLPGIGYTEELKMTAKQFLDSITDEDRERLFGCIVKVFEDDAINFAKLAGIKLAGISKQTRAAVILGRRA